MDPITLLIIGTGGAAAAGVAAAAGPLWNHVKLRRARELLTRPIIGGLEDGGEPKSVADVFRDLGSNGYALEVLRHLDLVPEREQDLEMVATNLSDAVASYGGYDQFVSILRGTIQELSHERDQDHAEILERRLTLSAPRQTDSLLPAVNRPSGQLEPGEEVKQLPQQASGGEVEQHLHATVDEAMASIFGEGRSPHAGSLDEGVGGLAAIVVGGVVGSLTSGSGFWEGVSRFVHQRRIKQMRSKLNTELAGLSLDLFHAPPAATAQVERNLASLVQEKRWTVERRRRELARHRGLPRKQRSSSQFALQLLASQDAWTSLTSAERDAKKLMAQITRHRRSGRHDLAGFLIYVNRKDLFKGVDLFEQRIQAIEAAGELLRQSLLAESPTPGGAASPSDPGVVPGGALSGPGQPAPPEGGDVSS